MQRGWVQKLPSGRWSIQWRNADGRQVRGGTYARKSDALAALRERVPASRHHAPADRDVTLGELVERFLRSYEAAPATRKRVAYQLGLATRAMGDTPIRRITPEDVSAWRLTLPAGSRHQIHAVLKMVLRRGQAWGLLVRNPCDEVRNPTPKREERTHFASWADIEQLDAELGYFQGFAIIGAGTGLRPAELLGLEAGDVDLVGRVLVVRRQVVEGRVLEFTKTSRSRRRVPLRSVVMGALEDRVARGGFVFIGERGGMLDLRAWRRRVWNPARDAAGLAEDLTPYAMRHTYASMSLAAGISTFQLARRMGTSVAMIDQTYGHLVAEQDDVERGLLDAWDEAQRGIGGED